MLYYLYMSKTQNKLILSLIILAFTFGLFWSLPAYARIEADSTGASGVTGDGYDYGGPNYYPNGYPNGYPYGNQNPRPVIFMLNPSSVNRNSGPFTAGITGNYFMPGAIAKLNGSNRTTTYISSTYLQMQLSYADTTGSGDYLVTVYNPTPGGGLSNSATLNISGTQVSGPITATATPTTTAKKTTTSTSTVAKSATTNGLEANVLSSGFLPSNIIQWLLFLLLVLLVIVFWRKIYISDKEKETPLKHA